MEGIQSSFLQACADGDVELAKQLRPSVPMDDVPFVQDAFTRAIDNGHPSIVGFLLSVSPPTFTARVPDQVLLHALDAGPEMYELFIRNDVAAARRSFGHMGDALASAVAKNDARLVRLLVDNGASPAGSHMFHRPIVEVVQGMKHVDEDILSAINQEKK